MSGKKSKKKRAEVVSTNTSIVDSTSASDGARPVAFAAPSAAKLPEPHLTIIGGSLGHAPKTEAYSRRLRWLVFGAIVAAWIFGFAMRADWLAGAEKQPNTVFDEHRLLTTADAYYYASGVKNVLDDKLAMNPRVPGLGDNILVPITAGVVVLFDWSVEEAALWMPAILAPLVAIPLILMGLMFGHLLWGFFASLIAVLGFSYWNRTVPGYFDTDMVSIPYVLSITTLLMAAFWRRSTLYGTLAALCVVAAPYIHPGSERVLAATALGVLGYAIVFERKNAFAYRIAIAVLVAFLPIPFWLRLGMIAALELAFRRFKVPLWTVVALSVGVFGVVLVKSPSMDMVLGAMGIKFHASHSTGQALGVKFPGVASTVAELQDPSLDKLGVRIAGGAELVVSGIIGFLLLAWRFRPFLMAVPLLALGTVLATVGQRYTIFAVPVIALGNVWLLLVAGRIIASLFRRRRRYVEAAVALLLMPLVLGPAVAHSLIYPARTALTATEASMLSKLAKRTQPGDFLIGWWDYAYGTWFHANVSTLVDGAKQNEDLWIAAEVMFTRSQREAATLMRLAVEAQVVHNPLDAVIDDLLKRFTADTGRKFEDFLPALRAGEVAIPKATRQIYFYIPWRIVQILPNVAKLRPAKGIVPEAELHEGNFIVMNQFNRDGSPLQGSPWTFDKKANVIVSSRGERVKVFKTTDIGTTTEGRVRSSDTDGHADGKVCVVNVNHSGLQLLMDRAIYESTLSQLLFLIRPDPKYFEPVSYTRGGVIYRVVP